MVVKLAMMAHFLCYYYEHLSSLFVHLACMEALVMSIGD